ncbi:hypothetical protein A2U01_0085086, partial [Trifolium medium]|nr:hypothetical protein [Trifolium medium]
GAEGSSGDEGDGVSSLEGDGEGGGVDEGVRMRDGLRLLEPVALVLEDPPTSSSLP